MKRFFKRIVDKWNYHMDVLLHKLYPITIGRFYFKKKLENIIVLESHTDFDTNGGAIYDYLIKNGFNQKYKIVWLLWNKLDRTLPPNVEAFRIYKPSLKKERYLYNAKIVSTDHLAYKKNRLEQCTFYLGHGAVSLKKPKGHMNIPQNTDKYLVASEYMRPITSDILGFKSPNEKELILGYPVHDRLYIKSPDKNLNTIISERYKKIIVWMPTFRRTSYRNDTYSDNNLGIPVLKSIGEYNQLNDVLKSSNMLLIIKIHPMQLLSDVKIDNTENIKILTINEQKKLNVDTYEVLKKSDALISDYSSIAFDYLHLNKPMGFTIDDIDKYKLGFIVDNPYELMGGPIINDYDSLLKFVYQICNDVDEFKEKREKIFDKVFQYHDGDSCKRLVNYWNL